MKRSWWRTGPPVKHTQSIVKPSTGQLLRQIGVLLAAAALWGGILLVLLGVTGSSNVALVAEQGTPERKAASTSVASSAPAAMAASTATATPAAPTPTAGGMKTGGRRTMIIPSKLAYGEAGVGFIPPNTDLKVVIELLEVKDRVVAEMWKVDSTLFKNTASGVKYAMISQGEGPAVEAGKVVTVHYSGYLQMERCSIVQLKEMTQ